MSQALQDIGPRATIEGLPRIDRYFPECRIAAIEAVSRFLFGIQDVSKAYGRHTFTYSKPTGPLAFRSNGVDLDLYIHRESLQERELDGLVEDIYGVRNECISFTRLEDYRRFCVDSISSGVPVITNFDLCFIKQRREYRKMRVGHVIVLFGYDATTRQLRAGEQMLGEIAIDLEDFEQCFEHRVAADGAMFVWTLQRLRPNERDFTRAEVAARIQANLDNLAARDDSLGLNALLRFKADLETYLQSPAFRAEAKPFAIPGLWVFSHERHILRKWLEAVRPLCADTAVVDELDQVLGTLFKRWLGADYLLEKCLMSGDGQSLRGLSGHLQEIVKEEQRALEGWQALQRTLAPATFPAR
jgi:hypothetical protein